MCVVTGDEIGVPHDLSHSIRSKKSRRRKYGPRTVNSNGSNLPIIGQSYSERERFEEAKMESLDGKCRELSASTPRSEERKKTIKHVPPPTNVYHAEQDRSDPRMSLARLSSVFRELVARDPRNPHLLSHSHSWFSIVMTDLVPISCCTMSSRKNTDVNCLVWAECQKIGTVGPNRRRLYPARVWISLDNHLT